MHQLILGTLHVDASSDARTKGARISLLASSYSFTDSGPPFSEQAGYSPVVAEPAISQPGIAITTS
jgi:hypothetical protein